MELWPPSGHSFSKRGHWVSGKHGVGQLDGLDERLGGFISAGVQSESWVKAQAEPAGKMEVPFATLGRLSFSQGYDLVTRLMMRGVLFIRV